MRASRLASCSSISESRPSASGSSGISTASSFPSRIASSQSDVAHGLLAARRGVPLVEDEVEHGEHRAKALGQHVIRRHAEGDAGVAHLSLRAHESLRHRGLGDEERPRDLRRRQACDLAQRQRHPCLGSECRVAAGEDECEPVVGDRAHVVLLGRKRLQAREQLGLAGERLLTAEPVDRPVPGCGDDPGAGVRRRPVAGPALERGRERVLHRVLGAVEIAEDAGEDGDGTAPFLPEDRADDLRQCSITGLSSTDARKATGIRAAIAIASSRSSALEHHDAADLLLRLGERAVGDDRLAVADAHGLRGRSGPRAPRRSRACRSGRAR